MSALDRDKARQVLRAEFGVAAEPFETALDRLAECVVTFPVYVLDKDGTEMSPRLIAAETKLSRILTLCDELHADAERDPNGGFGPGMQMVIAHVRDILDHA